LQQFPCPADFYNANKGLVKTFVVFADGEHYKFIGVGSVFCWVSSHQPAWLAFLWEETVKHHPTPKLAQRRTACSAGPGDGPARSVAARAPLSWSHDLAVIFAAGGDVVASTPIDSFTAYARSIMRHGGPQIAHATLTAEGVRLASEEQRVATAAVVLCVDSDCRGVWFGKQMVVLKDVLGNVGSLIASKLAPNHGFAAAALIVVTCGPPLTVEYLDAVRLAFRASTLAYLHVHSAPAVDGVQKGLPGHIMHSIVSRAIGEFVNRSGSHWALGRDWPDTAKALTDLAIASHTRADLAVVGDKDLARRVDTLLRPNAAATSTLSVVPAPDTAASKVQPSAPPALSAAATVAPAPSAAANGSLASAAASPAVGRPVRVVAKRQDTDHFVWPCSGSWRESHSLVATAPARTREAILPTAAQAAAVAPCPAVDSASPTPESVAVLFGALDGTSPSASIGDVWKQVYLLSAVPEIALQQLSAAATKAAAVGVTRSPVVRAYRVDDTSEVRFINFALALEPPGDKYFCRVIGCDAVWKDRAAARSHELRQHCAPKNERAPSVLPPHPNAQA